MDSEVETVEVEKKAEEVVKRFRITPAPVDKSDPNWKKKLRTETSFNVEYDDPEDGVTKRGLFRARRPTIGLKSDIAVMAARINGGQEMSLSASVLNNNGMLAYCTCTLIEKPDWWEPANLFDEEPLRAVAEHVRQWESSFRSGGVG